MGCSSKSTASSDPPPADGIERLPDLKPAAPTANGFQVILPIVV